MGWVASTVRRNHKSIILLVLLTMVSGVWVSWSVNVLNALPRVTANESLWDSHRSTYGDELVGIPKEYLGVKSANSSSSARAVPAEDVLVTNRTEAMPEVLPQQYRSQKKNFQLIHVWAPYVVRPSNISMTNRTNDDPFYPLDQAQNVTWGSIVRAKAHFERHNPARSVIVYCAILWMDVEILHEHEPTLCHKQNTIVLRRSSHTQFPHLSPPIHFPFVQDILNLSTSSGTINHLPGNHSHLDRPNSRRQYVIYTNADIAIVEKFYTLMLETIGRYRYEGFNINRQTIAKEGYVDGSSVGRLLTSNDLRWIEGNVLQKNYTIHPGIDCFVVRRDILEGVNLGTLFLGHPPWGRFLKRVMSRHFCKSYQVFDSHTGWTFHLGADRNWAKSNAGRNMTTEEYAATQGCALWNPPRRLTDHMIRNAESCAELMVGEKEAVQGLLPPPPFVSYKGVERFISNHQKTI